MLHEKTLLKFESLYLELKKRKLISYISRHSTESIIYKQISFE